VTNRPSTADSESRSGSLAARAAAHTARLHQARIHTPSPLGLSQGGPSSSAAPLAITLSVPPSPSHPKSLPSSPTVLRTISPAKSEPSLRGSQTRSVPERGAPPKSPADTAGSGQVASSLSGSSPEDASPLALIQSSASESQISLASRGTLGKIQGSLSLQRSSGELPGRTSFGVDASNHGEARLQGTTPAPASASGSLSGRSTSLRSKISLSALRARSSREDKRQDDGPGEGETVQVRDMDFELVRPVARPLPSEESPVSDKNSGSEGMPSFLRVDSPATSLASGTSGPRSPLSVTLPTPLGAATGTAVGASASAVEAHRARELKWISAMASTPPTHARKSKKIRKLLQEGVPASVRYQVWAHLTDCKARRIEGLYVQLGDREKKVPAHAEIQRDAQLCFPGDPRLSQPDGALTSLLRAYLTMVPDVQYSKGVSFGRS
jgi:TBC1 domain family member 10